MYSFLEGMSIGFEKNFKFIFSFKKISHKKRAAKRLRRERSETPRGDKVPGGRFAESDSLALLRPARFAARQLRSAEKRDDTGPHICLSARASATSLRRARVASMSRRHTSLNSTSNR